MQKLLVKLDEDVVGEHTCIRFVCARTHARARVYVCTFVHMHTHTRTQMHAHTHMYAQIVIYGFKFSAASGYLISSDWPLSGRLAGERL